MANGDHTLEWGYWVDACIGITKQWVMLWKSLLALLLPVRNKHFPVCKFYISFEVTRAEWLLSIHCSFGQSPVVLLVAISGIPCVPLTMFPTLISGKSTAARAFLTFTYVEMGSKLPEFSGILVSARLTSTQLKLHPQLGAWFWIVIAVAIGDAYSARHNTSPDIASTTPSCSYCQPRVRVTCQQCWNGPEKRFSSVPDMSKKPNCSVLAGLVPGADINPQFLAGFIILEILNFPNWDHGLQLSIWVVIVSQYHIYVKDAPRDPRSPPILQFAIWSLFVELLWNYADN